VTACLDSWAILAWLDGEEPAFNEVEAALAGRPVMSWISAVEVYDRLERDHGRTAADDVLTELRRVVDLDLPTQARMIETARVKATLAIALADCFALATAAAHRVPLYTGDPEILARIDLPCAVRDLRPGA
jgi:PIN domain nuclease of toxin-antitoxin system